MSRPSGDDASEAPLFAVVMAARDAATTVVGAIDSVLVNGAASVEVIVVDDGSVDDTAAVVAGLADVDARIRLVAGEGRGPGSARNLGLGVARGEWVTFLDADDQVDPGYLDAVATFLAEHGDETDALGVRTVRAIDGEVVDNHPLRFRFEHGARVVDLDAEPHVIQTSVATGFFRRSVIEAASVRFDEVARASEDADFVVSFLLAARPRLGLVPEATYVYRVVGETSLSRSAWSDPDKYTVPFERLYLGWLSRARAGALGPPRWLETMVLYELSTYLDADRAVFHPSQHVAQEVRAHCAALIRQVLAKVSPEAIEHYTVTPLGLDRRMMLLAVAQRPPRQVYRYQRHAWDPLCKYTYFFTGALPDESFVVDGRPAEPQDAKVVGHRLFDDIFVRERIVWLPDGEVEATLDGRPVRVAPYGGPPKRPGPSGTPAAVGSAGKAGDLEISNGLRPNEPTSRPSAKSDQSSRNQSPISKSPLSALATPSPDHGSWVASMRRVLGRARRRAGSLTSAARRRPRAPATRATSDADVSPEDHVWLYLDRSDHAGENAEALYSHAVREGIPGEHRFVLAPTSPDAARLVAAGFALVDPGGHEFPDLWARASDLLLSDLSDPAVGEALSSVGIRNDQRLVFLQHGILTKRLWRWLNPRRVDLMLTTTEREHDWIVHDDASYTLTGHEVKRTGLPRHDALLASVSEVPDRERVIVLMAPTWDQELHGPVDQNADIDLLLDRSAWGRWIPFCVSSALSETCGRRGWRPVFFLHPRMREAASLLDARGVPWVTGADLPAILTRSRVVVTDRSSILDEGLALGIPGIVVGSPDSDADAFVAFHEAEGVARADDFDGVLSLLEGDLVVPSRGRAEPGATERVWSILLSGGAH